ncbi:hypothetical protein D3C71_1329560 [compost metagenome]
MQDDQPHILVLLNGSYTGGGSRWFATEGGIAASELLTSESNGEWLPTIKGLTSGVASAYSVQAGWFEKIGRSMHFGGSIRCTGFSGTGSLAIDFLPLRFNPIAGRKASISFGVVQGVNFGTGRSQLVGWIDQNTSVIRLGGIGSRSGSIDVAYADCDAAAANSTVWLDFSGSYQTEF